MSTRALVIAVSLCAGCIYQTRDIDACIGGDSGCPLTTDDDSATDTGPGGDHSVGADPIGTGGDPTDPDNPCGQVTCDACASGDTRPEGIAGDCCPACVRTDFGCTSPPRQCTDATDCRSGDSCVHGFCGKPSGSNLDIGDGTICTPSSCWDSFDHYRGNCCPSCTVPCGVDACAPEDCVGASCFCMPGGGACLDSSCACTI